MKKHIILTLYEIFFLKFKFSKTTNKILKKLFYYNKN